MHIGTAAGSPAAAPERLGTEVPRHPNTVLGGDEASRLTHPHDPSTRRVSVAVTIDSSSHGLGHPMLPSDARDQVGRPDGCHLCSHKQRRPRHCFAPSSCSRGVHVWTTTEAATLPRAPRERVRGIGQPDVSAGAPRHIISSAHLIRSFETDRVDVAANTTSSMDPRFVAVSEPRLPAGPVPPRRSKPRLSSWSHGPKSAIPSEMKPQRSPVSDDGHPHCSVATAWLHEFDEDPGSKSTVRANPSGEPRDHASVAATSCASQNNRGVATTERPQDAASPKACAARDHFASANRYNTHRASKPHDVAAAERSRHLARPILPPKRRDKSGSAPRCLPVLPPKGARQVTTSPHETNAL